MMEMKLSQDNNETHTMPGIFDMNIFLSRLNFAFKCIGLKHSKFIGYKMQMIPFLGFLFTNFNLMMQNFYSGNELSFGPMYAYRMVYWVYLNWMMLTTINEGKVEHIFKSSLSLEFLQQNNPLLLKFLMNRFALLIYGLPYLLTYVFLM